MAVNPALKQVSEFKGTPEEMNRRHVQAERNVADKTRAQDKEIRDLKDRPQTLAAFLLEDFTKASSTTLADVGDLGTAIAANQTLVLNWELYIAFGGGDCKYSVAVPNGAAVKVWILSVSTTTAIAESTTAGASLTIAGIGDAVVSVRATVVNGETAGDVQLRAAQNSSSATAFVIEAKSHMRATVAS